MFYIYFKNMKDVAVPDDADLAIVPDTGRVGNPYWELMAGDKLLWASLSRSALEDTLTEIHKARLYGARGVTVDVREAERKHSDEMAEAVNEIEHLRSIHRWSIGY